MCEDACLTVCPTALLIALARSHRHPTGIRRLGSTWCLNRPSGAHAIEPFTQGAHRTYIAVIALQAIQQKFSIYCLTVCVTESVTSTRNPCWCAVGFPGHHSRHSCGCALDVYFVQCAIQLCARLPRLPTVWQVSQPGVGDTDTDIRD